MGGGPNIFTEGLFEIADVVATRRAPSGEILSNLGDAQRGTGIDADVPAWGTPGFVSFPVGPTGSGSEQAVFYVDGNRRFVFGRRDRRYTSNIGEGASGDAVVHGLTSGARLRVIDGSATVVVETNQTPTNYRVVLGSSGVDVTGISTATQSVALYPALQGYVTAEFAWIGAAQAALLAILAATLEPVPGPLTTALLTTFAALASPYGTLTTPLTGSSAVLKASPT